MKVLVTGANGFLGSWLTRRLIELGHDVSIIARSSSDLSELDGLEYKKLIGDVTDLPSLEKAFRGQDTIFHLAGVIAYKAADRPLMEKANVQGTANVVSAMKNASVHDLVYLSSVVAIGAGFSQHEVLNENSPYNIHHLNLGYFETKHEAEKIVKAATGHELRSVILNPSTIYGAGDAKKGSRKMQIKVARHELPFYTPGGVNVVAVEDVIDGLLAAWKKGRSGERYILAGDNLLIKDLFAQIAEAAGVPAPQIQMPSFLLHGLGFLGDQAAHLGLKAPFSGENAWTSTLFHWFDNSKAKAELGFQPRPSAEAIRQSVQWMREKGYLNK